METWLIFAIISAFAAWLHNFLIKVMAERKYDISIVNIITYFVSVIFFTSYILIDYKNINFTNWKIVSVFGFAIALFFYLSVFSRVKSMKNIDTVIFYPIYKTIWPILVMLISIFFFWESLTNIEFLWIILWFSIPLLLINKKESSKQKNLYIWIFYIIVTAILTAIMISFSKESMVRWDDIILLFFSNSISGLFLAILSNYFLNHRKKKKIKIKWLVKFGLISWFIHLISGVTMMLSLKWNLAIAYTINSFSILIPIILSVIFYKEEMTYKKAFVIFLSIISMLLFI